MDRCQIKSINELQLGQNAQKKCLLLHVPTIVEYKPGLKWSSFANYIAMGLFSLCHQLESKKINTEIVHLGMEKLLDQSFSISNYIKDSGVKFVGMSLHWHFQTYDTIEVARAIKKHNPDVYIVLGGYTASCFADEILEECPFIDSVIKGEGEASIAELAEKVFCNKNNDLEDIPNLHWRKDDKIIVNSKTFVATSEDLDKFSFYSELKKLKNHSLYVGLDIDMVCVKEDGENLLKNDLVSDSIHTICLGRGCTGNCTWCGGGAKAIKKLYNRSCVSWRSPQKTAEEMLMLKREYGINNFYFCFDPTPSDRTKIIEMFRFLGQTEEKISIFFECFGLPTEDFLQEFKHNLSLDSKIAISPEFANENLRKKHKSFYFTNKELENVLNRMEELNIKSTLFFTHLPTLTKEDEEETNNYIKYLREKFSSITSAVNFPIMFFEPCAPWTEAPSDYGINIERKTFKDFYLEHSEPNISWESSDFY